MSIVEAKKTLSGTAYELIKREILACRLAPGTTVVANQLAADFGMSRMPVHEALKALCSEGYMRVVPRVGYLVTPVSMADVREIYQLRLVVEPLGASLAAQRFVPSDSEKFKEWVRTGLEVVARLSSGQPDGGEALFALNRQFHVMVAGLSGNERLAHLVGSLIDQTQRIYYLQFVPDEPVGDPHGEVFRSIEAQDPTAAAKAMRDHINHGQEATIRALSGLAPN